MKKHTHTIPKKILKKKKELSTLIRVKRENKNPPKENRERERESTHIFVFEKHGLNEKKSYQIYT